MPTITQKPLLVEPPEVFPGDRYPGPKSQTMLEEIRRYVLAEPYPFAVDLEHCEGMYLATVDGQKLMDWAGFFGSKLIAYNHPAMLEPAFLRKLQYAAITKVPNPDLLTPECVEYYRELHTIAPVCMRNPRLEAYAINSGAEAVENMMKYLMNLHAHKVREKNLDVRTPRFLYFDSAFHGRTVFALNVTHLAHDPSVTRGFQGIIPGNVELDFPAIDTDRSADENHQETEAALRSIEKILTRLGPEVVAIIVEPIQGAGGHRMAEPVFFRRLSELCHKHDCYLGFDEVQTAGGQTGTIFAVDQFDLPHPPQVIATGKKMGNGVVYMYEPMQDRNVLDSTWGGALSDMVRFTREMQIVRDEGLIEAIPEKEKRLCATLDALLQKHNSLVRNRRGMGIYQGFSLRDPQDKARLVKIAREQEDLLLLGAGTDTIRLRPCLHITEKDIDLFGEKLDRALESLQK